MSRKRILVTGATGFLGQYVCRALADRGHCVIGVARAKGGLEANLSGVVDDWFEWDMGSNRPVVLPRAIDTIIHLAQSHQFRNFPDGASDVFSVNVASTFAILEAARAAGVSRFIYASSGGIYGQGGSAFTEQEPIIADHKLGFYLTSKLISELLSQNYSAFFSVGVLRIFFAYGPGQQDDRLIMRLIDNVAQGRPLTLAGEEGLTINPIFATDAAEAIARALEIEALTTLNVAGAEAISLRRLGQVIAEVVGREPVYRIESSTAPPSLVGDPSRMRDVLNFRPRVSLVEGIRQTAADILARKRR